MRHHETNTTARTAMAAALGLALGAAPAFAAALSTADGVTARPKLDAKVSKTLDNCAAVAPTCGDMVNQAPAVLVFPNVVTAELGVGGAGGRGALVEHGKITGYYDIGKASAGLQAGIKKASQVYVIRSADTLAKLKTDGNWALGGDADVTVADAHASASAQSDGTTVYVFDAKGLSAGLNVSALRIWHDESEG